ncbi:unnamed protein product [Timema podura]|uniref:C2H2-type domain-containing protein n=1 Tax=Timema podura TaxID=61482 RepID=A0ABN7NWZ3_TIMPD|nr:unnamed protein product [Timema podura]
MEDLQEFLFVDCDSSIKIEPQVKSEETSINNSLEPEYIFPDSLPQIAPHIKTRTKDKHKSKVNAVGMRYLRNERGNTRMDRVSNEWVLKECGLKGNPIGQWERSVLRWFGHVERMSVDLVMKQIYEGSVCVWIKRKGYGTRITRPKLHVDNEVVCLDDEDDPVNTSQPKQYKQKDDVPFASVLFPINSVTSRECWPLAVDNPYPCCDCTRLFLAGDGLSRSDAALRQLRHLKCKKCFKNRLSLKLRSLLHSGSLQCKECGCCSVDTYNLTRHLLVHKRSTQHVCPRCNKLFHRRENLQVHMFNTHGPTESEINILET